MDWTEPCPKFDPWEMRRQFFRLKERDAAGAIEFLNRVGVFHKSDDLATLLEVERGENVGEMFDSFHYVVADDGAHRVRPSLLPLTTDRFWEVRKQIQGGLNTKAGEGTQWDFTKWDFKLRFSDLRRRPAMIVTTVCFADALAASIRIDEMRKAKWRKCQRRDCGETFAAIGPRKRKFCSWYCGHIHSVRKGREKK
jgi:hypothetical protein